MNIKPLALLLVVIQIGIILVTTGAVIVSTYETRQQFAELERLRVTQRALEVRWSKLLLEESAFSSPARVERIARNELQMVLPSVDDVKELTKINKAK